MLGTIASRLTDQLYNHCTLDPSKKAIYKYGIQLSISSFASVCSIVLLGILLGDVNSAMIFIGVFFFLRLYTGGYHASTYSRCFILTNSVFLAVFVVSQLIEYLHWYNLLPVITVGACFVIILMSPIQNKNHPLSKAAYTKNKRIAWALSIFESSIMVLLFLWKDFHPLLSILVMSFTAVAVMMLITLKERRIKQ